MAINLTIVRRHSLAGLGEGWTDDTYVRVEACTTSEVTEMREAGLLSLTGEESYEQLRKVLKNKIKGGKVLDTKPDGTSEVVDFGPEDVKDVIKQLPNVILQEIFNTSLGFTQAK